MTVLYAICAGDAIKFGVTENSVQSRLESLQTGNATTLDIAAEYESDFAYELESAIFDRLAEYRIRGEWYFPTAAVLELIEVMRSADLRDYLSRGPEAEHGQMRNWQSLARQAEARKNYMREYMRKRRAEGRA